jgi:hypothetical protein
MKRKKQVMVTPVWAQKIEVEKKGYIFVVTGWGHISSYLSAKDQGAQELSALDLLARFRRYALRQLSEKQGATEAGVYQFADATDDEKLLAFVREFGPVWGEVQSVRNEGDGTKTIVVDEEIGHLHEEQERFSAAVELLARVKGRKGPDPVAIVQALGKLAAPYSHFKHLTQLSVSPPERVLPLDAENVTPELAPEYLAWLAKYAKLMLGSSHPKGKEVIIWIANQALCTLFNWHHPCLVPFDAKTVELPFIAQEGIRNALYFKLRLDYLAQRTIGTCLHCGGHFPVYKRGARACGESCRRALRNQKYWAQKSKTINRKRRARTRRK